MKNAGTELGYRLSSINFSTLPQEVRHAAKMRLLDVLGIGLASSQTGVRQHLSKWLLAQDTAGDSTVWGCSKRTSAALAALVNGASAFHLELDDVHRTSHTHPGVTTIPAALSVAEREGRSGPDLIAAIVAGYDAQIMIGQAVSPSIFLHRPLLPPGVLGAFGAAAATCRLLGFDADTTTGVLGAVASLTPLSVFEAYRAGCSIKEVVIGWANMVGVIAADLAQFGFVGPDSALDGEQGFFQAVASAYDMKKAFSGVRPGHGVLSSGFKPYACCRQHHSAVDAMLQIRNNYPVSVDDIDSIIVRTFKVASRGGTVRPTSVAAAKYSIPFIVATALVHGRVWKDEFTPERLSDQVVLEVARKVKTVCDEELDRLYDEKWPCLIEVRCKTGKIYRARVDLPKGEPEHPVTRDEIIAKFLSLSSGIVEEESAERIIDMVDHLESLSDVRRLTCLLVPGAVRKRASRKTAGRKSGGT